MSIFKDGKESYKGQVIRIDNHMWLDGMEDEHAVVWDTDNHKEERIQVGYRGIDCQNLMGDSYATVDATDEIKRDILRTLKRRAQYAFAESVKEYKRTIRRGSHVKVVRGRKIPKGTELEVFWVGEKETYQSRQYNFMNETETIVGGYTSQGEKIFVKAEYCVVTDKIQSPSKNDRKAFIKEYISREIKKIMA